MIRKKPFSFPGISPGQAAWLLLFLLLLLERVGPSGVVPSVAEEISLGKSSVPALAAGVENLERY